MRLAIVAAVATLPAACLDPWPANVCESAVECTLEAGGECTPGPMGVPWCSYPASECATGRRWSSLAGDGLAGDCVGAADAAGPMYSVTVTFEGGGIGTVSSSPPGLACDSTCTADFPIGAPVTLSAMPGSDSNFLGWSGDCTGTAECQLTGDSDKSITAEFREFGEVVWLKHIESDGSEHADAVDIDAAGDVFIGGYYDIVLTIDGDTREPLNDESDIFIAKLDGDNGALVWLKTFGDLAPDTLHGLAVDGNGDVVVTGSTEGMFALGATTVGPRGFAAKLAGADGSVVWAVTVGGGESVSIGLDGHPAVVGFFSGSVQIGAFTLDSLGGFEAFVAKLDADDGHALWAKPFGGMGADWGRGIAVDSGNNVLATGRFEGLAPTLGLTSQGATDVFLIKLDSQTGDRLWEVRAGGTGVDEGRDVAVGASDSVIVAGSFSGSGSFGGDPVTSNGPMDVFLAKYSAASAHVWSFGFGGDASDFPTATRVSPRDDVLVGGVFRQTTDFGGGPVNATNDNTDDLFVAQYAADRTYQWARTAGGTESDIVTGVGARASRVAVTGWFSGICDFGDAGTRTAALGPDSFVMLLAP